MRQAKRSGQDQDRFLHVQVKLCLRSIRICSQGLLSSLCILAATCRSNARHPLVLPTAANPIMYIGLHTGYDMVPDPFSSSRLKDQRDPNLSFCGPSPPNWVQRQYGTAGACFAVMYGQSRTYDSCRQLRSSRHWYHNRHTPPAYQTRSAPRPQR